MTDSKMILDNIYYLAEQKKIAIKTLEQKAGLSTGYLTRLKREDGGDKLSIKTLKAIARELKTEIATLVESNIENLETNSLLVNNFLNNLQTKTLNGEIGWNRIVLPIGEEVKGIDTLTMQNHPLISLIPRNSNAGPLSAFVDKIVVYNSGYYGELTIAKIKSLNIYTADTGNGSQFYLTSMNIPSEKEGQQDVLEAYMIFNGTRNSIKREYMKESEKKELQRLYETVVDLMEKPRLQPKIADLMKSFVENEQ